MRLPHGSTQPQECRWGGSPVLWLPGYLHPDKLCPIAKEAVENASKAASCEAERQALQSKITALTTNLDQMYTDRLSGLLSEEDFQRIYQKVKMDRTVLEDRLKSLQSSR